MSISHKMTAVCTRHDRDRVEEMEAFEYESICGSKMTFGAGLRTNNPAGTGLALLTGSIHSFRNSRSSDLCNTDRRRVRGENGIGTEFSSERREYRLLERQ